MTEKSSRCIGRGKASKTKGNAHASAELSIALLMWLFCVRIAPRDAEKMEGYFVILACSLLADFQLEEY
jgi:hypothetical protein